MSARPRGGTPAGTSARATSSHADSCEKRRLSTGTLPADSVVLAASAHYVEGAVDLATQNGTGEGAAEIQAGLLPQQCPRHRQPGVRGVPVAAGGVAEPITRVGHRIYRGCVEPPAGIGEMPDARPQPGFNLLPGCRRFFRYSLLALIGHRSEEHTS